jgi:hypothetical protein
MSYIMGLIFACMALGLFAPRWKPRMRWVIPALAAALVVLFLLSPYRM